MSERRSSYLSARTTSTESNGNPSRIPGRAGKGRERGSNDPDFSSRDWASNHLPEEHYGYTIMAAGRCWVRQPKGKRKVPTEAEVLAELRRVGKDRESLS